VDLNRIPPVLLQTFLTVAEAGQISEAARRLHLTRPAVIGHIRRLEASLETTLFIRSANGVSLTERGAHLRERVQDVFAELEEIWRELDRTHEVNGTLTLAASTTVARYFVPRIFIRFHHYHPAAALHLIRWQHRRSAGPSSTNSARGSYWSRGISVVQVYTWSSSCLMKSFRLVPLEFSGCFLGPCPAAELGGLPGEFYQFANSIRSDLSAVSVRPLKEAA
jgi:molybdenum-dependent DNA-binding transcriptional regulator ModE